jgi:polysaccharide lyase-like protein
MRHAPSFDYVCLRRASSNLDSLLLTVLAAGLWTAACTSAESHPGNGTGGQGTGSGGSSSSSGGSGGSSNGSGGTTAGTGGRVADAGSDAPSSGSGGATGTGCSSLPLCDDFESGTLNTALWTIVNANNASAGSATIDTIGAHGSGHSVKVAVNDRFYLRNSTVIGTLGPVAHVRFYARFMMALPANHAAIVVTHPTPADQYSQNNELRFGSQDAVFHWNTDSDAANIPVVGPGDSSSVGVTANTWYCFELTINTGNGHLNVSINGNDVAGLTEDGVATPNIDQDWVGSAPSLMRYTALADVNFGWASYGAGPMTIWFDDVALSGAPIGCPN